MSQAVSAVEGPMNEMELHAYGKLAQALAERAYQLAEGDLNADALASQFPNAPRPILAHNDTFTSLALVLWPLGILRPLNPGPKGWASAFAFECSTEEAAQVAERNSQNGGPSLPELLEAFIDFFDSYGKDYHDFSSAIYVPFGRNGRMTQVLNALVPLGYVEKANEGYIWTDAEPVMRILYGFKGLSDPDAFDPRA